MTAMMKNRLLFGKRLNIGPYSAWAMKYEADMERLYVYLTFVILELFFRVPMLKPSHYFGWSWQGGWIYIDVGRKRLYVRVPFASRYDCDPRKPLPSDAIRKPGQ